MRKIVEMKRIISGILRFVLVFMFTEHNIVYFIQMNSFQKFPSMTGGHKYGFIIILLIVINFIVYMVFNGVRDFQDKPIRLKPMYIIFLLTILIAGVVIIPVGNIQTSYLISLIVYAILSIYFIIKR
jgi:hypothetical protein